jgi:hypothetical protein
VSLDRFVSAAKAVEKDWSKLKSTERADQLGDAANAELKRAEVPEVGVVLKDLGQADGNLDFGPWNLNLNDARFKKEAITAAEMAPVADTVYHESRHAEQWHRMARLEAGQGQKGPQIASKLGIKRSVADDAASKPLTGDGPLTSEAKKWHESVYGTKGNDRNNTLKALKTDGADLNTKVEAVQAAQKAYETLVADPSATPEAKQKALDEWETAYAAYEAANTKFDATYKAYRDLPEEADAWALGDRVMTAYQKK